MSSQRTFLLSLTAWSACGASIVAAPAMGQNIGDRFREVAVQQQQQRQADRTSTRAQIFGALVYTDITVEFSETPAREAFEYLRTQMGIQMIVRWSTDRNAISGVDPEMPVTLTFENRPALVVLESILEAVTDFEPMTWQLRNTFLEVGPKDRLNAAAEIRFYPIRDLLFEPTRFDNAPIFDIEASLNQGDSQGGGGGGGGGGGFGGGGGSSGGGGGGSGGGGGIFGQPGAEPDRVPDTERAEELMQIIEELVEPDYWLSGGGTSIRYHQGVLIIRAPDYVHRQLGGYPFAARPRQSASRGVGRYVTFTAPFTIVENVDFATVTVSGAAGGNNP